MISNNYARVLWTFGRFAEAEALLRKTYLTGRGNTNGDYLKIGRLFNSCRSELPVELIDTSGEIRVGDPRVDFNLLYAFAVTEQWDKAAELIGKMAFEGRADDRLIMYLTLYGEQLTPATSQAGLPEIALMLQKLKLRSVKRNQSDQNLSAVVQFAQTVLSQYDEDGHTYPKVSYICPVHRASDVPNLLAQLERQDWPNAEVIFCINGPDITEEDLKLSEGNPFELRHLHMSHDLKIGQYLQASGDMASGDIIMRIDADDTYLENYTRYMVGCLQHLKADGIAQNPIPFVFEGAGLTFLPNRYKPEPYGLGNESPRKFKNLGSGSTITVRKEVFDAVKHDGTVVVGEDANFLWSMMKAGFKFYSVGGMDHEVGRSEDKSQHTWGVHDLSMLGDSSLFLCDGAPPHSLGEGVPGEDIDDPFGDLVEEEAFEGFSELKLEHVLRTPPLPIRLIADETTKMESRNHPLLEVGHDPQEGASFRGLSLAFAPNDPDKEARISSAHGVPAFCHDILPGLVARNTKNPSGLIRAESGRREDYRDRYDQAGLRYAILSNPRSGSTHLCSLLESMGLGRPQEVLRVPAATALENSQNPTDLFRTFLGAAELEGVVGTKLITQYLTENLSDRVSQDLLRWMVGEGFRFILLSRPDEDAARSAHVAESRGVWHSKRGKTYKAAGAELDAAGEEAGSESSDAGMELALQKTLGYSRWLENTARPIIPADQLIEVSYEGLVNSEADVISSVINFLDFAPLPGSVPVSIVQKTPTSLS